MENWQWCTASSKSQSLANTLTLFWISYSKVHGKSMPKVRKNKVWKFSNEESNICFVLYSLCWTSRICMAYALQIIWKSIEVLWSVQQPDSAGICAGLLRFHSDHSMVGPVHVDSLAGSDGNVCDGKRTWARWKRPADATDDHALSVLGLRHHHVIHIPRRQETFSSLPAYDWDRYNKVSCVLSRLLIPDLFLASSFRIFVVAYINCESFFMSHRELKIWWKVFA